MGLGPILAISPTVFDGSLADRIGGTYMELQQQLSKGEHKSKAVQPSIEIHIDAEPQEDEANNVVAQLRGSDALLQDEWLLLSAHYDHLGSHEIPAGEDGIWNGADDNASGTAAVLETPTFSSR